MSALGFDEYIDSHGDGLQILRYNLTTAYNTHLDWITDEVRQELSGPRMEANELHTTLTQLTTLHNSVGPTGTRL